MLEQFAILLEIVYNSGRKRNNAEARRIKPNYVTPLIEIIRALKLVGTTPLYDTLLTNKWVNVNEHVFGKIPNNLTVERPQ